MDYSSENDSDISESEIEEFEEKTYSEMKNGKIKVKIADENFRCPFCLGKKRQNYRYKELLQHAIGVGKGSHSRGIKQKAEHVALAKYMEKDLAPVATPSQPTSQNVPPTGRDRGDIFVCPWYSVAVISYTLSFQQYSMEAMVEALEEREEELEDLEALNQTLIVRLRKSTDELQEARKVLINGLREMKEMPNSSIKVKKMGELDTKPFQEACKRKYAADDADVQSIELISLWEEYLRQPAWQPFKRVEVDGVLKEIVDEEDEKLNELKQEYGAEVCNAVAKALLEMNEYNPSERCIIPELWNMREDRKATLKDGAEYLVNLWKGCKCRKT